MNRSQCLIWSRPRAPPCPWEMRKDLQNRGPLLFSVPGMVRKAALAFSERLCNLMLLSGLTRRHLLALDPSAKFNFRSSQGPTAAQGHRIHEEEIPGRCQKLTTVPSCSRPPPAMEVTWSGGLHTAAAGGGVDCSAVPLGQGGGQASERRRLFVVGDPCTCAPRPLAETALSLDPWGTLTSAILMH